MAGNDPISPLALDEYLAAGDDRFLPALRNFHEPKKLAAIADRWKKDHRPWARERIEEYLRLPMNVPGHEPVIKRLFKWAEERGDDGLMGAFAEAFDRLVRRVRKTKHHYDWQTRTSWQEERLVSPRDTIPHVGKNTRVAQNPKTLEPVIVGVRYPKDGRLFSKHTRYYLRRRAWRYFRRKGHQKPKEYCESVANLLRRYTDDSLASGESLLDSWSLMHACFRESDVLAFEASRVNVREGCSLSELVAAPDFPELWRKPDGGGVLIDLLAAAQARAVRVWTIQLLRRDHMQNLNGVTIDQILALLDHADGEVQQFAAEILEASPLLPKLDLATWLKLLQTRNVAALEIIARLMEQHVRPDRLTLEQMVDLANAAPVPVARLGLAFLKTRTIASAADRQAIARLSHARSAGAAGEITTWALSILGTPEHYDVENVSPFFDSLVQPARDAAWDWLNVGATLVSPSSRPQRAGETSLAPTKAVSAGYHDPALWSRLIETPYDDVRFHVVDALQRRVTLPGAADEQVAFVWTSVLLGVHRGGRAKLAALRQISRAIADDPARAEPLLPVLAVAIRSVRLPEVRTGMSALVAAVEKHPPLADAIARHLPELRVAEEVAV
jgi:hypothetical protein